MPLIIDPSAAPEVNKVRDANNRLYSILKEHCPEGVGFILVTFDSPMSLRRPQVAMATEHDAVSVDRILSGIVRAIRDGNGRGLVSG